MSNGKYPIGKGTKLYVAPLLDDCARVAPESTVFEVTLDAAAAATSLSVSLTPPTTKAINASATKPLYLNFTEADGREHLVKVTAPITAGATATLTVAALKREIKTAAEGPFPVLLQNRTSANISDNDNSVDVMTFDNDGWRDSMTTMLGNGVEAAGYYSPLDAGWNICKKARDTLGEIYWELHLPKPGCEGDTLYTKGHIFKGFGGVAVPIEIPADGLINSNVTITARGPVTTIDPQ